MSYVTDILADVPVGFWRLNDATTTAVDSASVAHNGTISGTGYTLAQPSITREPTDLGLALSSTSYVAVPYAAALNLTADMSVECWVALTGVGNYTFVSHESGYRLDMLYGQIRFIAWDASGNIFIIMTSGAPYNDGLAHHIVGTKVGAVFCLYVDNVLVSTDAYGPSTLFSNTTAGLRIGTISSGLGSMTGTIQCVAIYNTCLSASQVYVHYTLNRQMENAIIYSPIGRRAPIRHLGI